MTNLKSADGVEVKYKYDENGNDIEFKDNQTDE